MNRKRLKDLLVGVDYKLWGGSDREVDGIADDSRKIEKDYLFVAIKGLAADGYDYIDSAIENGAVAVVCERKPKEEWLNKITYIQTRNVRQALGIIAANWFGNPTKKLKVIGVTGTDGKTTTASLIYHILITLGKKTGLVSTVSAKIGNKEYDTGFHVTNPEPLALQKFLARMVEEGCVYAVVEVTSHGIDQERIAGVEFDTAVLTNITNEHLDYHKTFDNYKETKAKLFRSVRRIAVLNKDDPSYDYFCTIVNKSSKTVSYSIDDDSADYHIFAAFDKSQKLSFTMSGRGQILTVSSNLVGEFNVSNILAAVATCLQFGLKADDVAIAVASFVLPKGRIQEIKNDRGLRLIIDYAHTPNAVEKVLQAFVSKKGSGRIICLVSAEGERDPGKRISIPETSVKYADITILNPIDPRSENVEKILSEMEKGAMAGGGKRISKSVRNSSQIGKHSYIGFIDRQDAIEYAIDVAEKNDLVLLLGKGHETGMDYGGHEEPWSDFEAVKKVLNKK